MWKVGLMLSSAIAASSIPAPSTMRVGLPAVGRARADENRPTLVAVMTCEQVEAPGRVRCDAEARVGPDESITWGDLVIVRLPPFASALRGRIGPHDATARDPGRWRWALALVARGRGRGDVEARVRVVVCRDGRCAPREAAVTGRIAVGE